MGQIARSDLRLFQYFLKEANFARAVKSLRLHNMLSEHFFQ